ncbi:SDR family NAD(P)-dependent oxidoreductase [Erythrobacter alti]|uniref:SDR family NAD(P)-dependent oxidoreductase n=1 Tax=Erythrobacter alti TaxID=1896145 RepID=UPI0030F46118
MSTDAPVALVTGASRGAGRGIARALGSHGCKVYVTGRSISRSETKNGTIQATADEVTAAGGRGIAVQCDHGDGEAVAALFAQIEHDEGRLDILVNNACAIQDALTEPGTFWEKPISLGRMIDVGVKSSYEASWHAAQIMVRQGSGLIAFTSAPGAVHYCLGPAYGAHKAGLDKLAADMAVDLDGTGVSAVSIWMGALATERLLGMIEADPVKYGHLADALETPDFTGHAIWALFNDPELKQLSGQAVIGAEMATRYGFTDANGKIPSSARDTHKVAPRENYKIIVR